MNPVKRLSLSLSQKITSVIMLTTVIALLIAFSMMFFHERKSIRDVMTHKHAILATTIGMNCRAALAFHDQDAARLILLAVKADPRVETALLFDRDNQLFADYRRPNVSEEHPFKKASLIGKERGQDFTRSHLTTSLDVTLDGERVGTIVLVSDLQRMDELVENHLRTMAYVIVVALLIVFFISLRVQRIISAPIIKLKDATKSISKGRLDTRLAIDSNDEIGELVSSFNDMSEKLEISRDELITAKVRAEDSERKTRAALAESEKLRKAEEKALIAQRALMEAEKQRIAAEEANRAKSDFLANMSHELRTPLHGILSFAGFGLRKYNVVESNQLYGYFQQIEQSGKILLSLLNDLLDLSKLEAGKMDFQFQKEDLTAWIEVVLDEFRPLVYERNLKLEYKKPNFSPVVRHDSRRVMQVLRNLLSNAVKFSTSGGKIELKIDTREGSIQVSVRDGGVGIPDRELEAIFDKFIQSTKTKTGAGGTGLGLSICREIVAAHKGRIWAENNPEGGSTFRFLLPVDGYKNTKTPKNLHAAITEDNRQSN